MSDDLANNAPPASSENGASPLAREASPAPYAGDNPIEANIPRRWRTPPVPLGQARTERQWQLFQALMLLTGLTGLLVGLVRQVGIHSPTVLLPLVVTDYHSPLLPDNGWARNDLSNLQQGGVFAAAPSVPATILSWKQFHASLATLRATQAERLVVYVSALALVDGRGAVQLLPADYDPRTAPATIALSEILQELRAAPCSHKLLLLDMMRPWGGMPWSVASLQAGSGQDIASAVEIALNAVPDPARSVLTACAAGQEATGVALWKTSTFGHYLVVGLRGQADGYGPHGRRNGIVTLRELHGFLANKVDHLAQQLHGQWQTPQLWGNQADWPIVVLADLPPVPPPSPPAAPAEGDENPPAAAPSPEPIPPWLAEGWKTLDDWTARRVVEQSSRLYGRLAARLVHLTTRWHEGKTPDALQAELQGILVEAKSGLAALEHASPPAVSLAQANRGLPPVTEAARARLDNLVTRWQQAAPLPAAEAAAPRDKLRADLAELVKERPASELPHLLLQLATQGNPPTAARLVALHEVLATVQPQARYVETAALAQAAQAAQSSAAWPASAYQHWLEIMGQWEETAADPDVYPPLLKPMRQLLGDRHDATMLLTHRTWVTPQAWATALEQARKHAQVLRLQQEILQQGRAVWQQALWQLPLLAPGPLEEPSREAAWLQAVEASIQLANALQQVDGPPSAPAPADSTTLAEGLEGVQQRTQTLVRLLTVLFPGTDAATLAQTEADWNSLATRRQATQKLRALLNWPPLTWETRRRLWEALRHRQEQVLRQISTRDEEEARGAAPFPPALWTAAEVAQQRRQDQLAAATTARVARALAQLGGIPAEQLPLPLLLAQEGTLSPSPSLGEALQTFWWVTLPQRLPERENLEARARLVAVLSPLLRLEGVDVPGHDPAWLVRQQRRRWLQEWLIESYNYLARDGASPFYQEAVRLLKAAGPLPPSPTGPFVASPVPSLPELHLDDRADESGNVILMTLRRWSGTGQPALAVLPPASSVLRVQVAMAALQDERTNQWQVPIQVAFSPEAKPALPPDGLLVRATLENMPFYRAVAFPEALRSRAEPLELLVGSANAREAELAPRVQVRPLLAAQPRRVYVRHFGSRPREVIVELEAGAQSWRGKIVADANRVTAVSFEPASSTPVAGASPPVPAAESNPALRASAPTEGFVTLTGPLHYRLREAATNRLLASGTLPVTIMPPRQYVTVDEMRYIPKGPGNPTDRLTVLLRATAALTGPPCVVRLSLAPERIAGLQGFATGTLEGTLAKPGDTLRLFAENLRWEVGPTAESLVALQVDDEVRALNYRGRFPLRGEAVLFEADDRPHLRLEFPRYQSPRASIAVRVEVDAPPPAATVDVELGRFEEGRFARDSDIQVSPARRQQVEIKLAQPGELHFRAAVTDWVLALPAEGMRGDRVVQARLLSNEQTVRVASEPLTIEPEAAAQVKLLGVPAQAKQGQKLALQAVAASSRTPVRQVLFFAGKPRDGKRPAEAATIDGAPAALATAGSGAPLTWNASLALPADRLGPVDVSVEVLNEAGLSSFATATVELLATEPVIAGKIEGTVTEGPRPQPNLAVTLYDEAGKEKGKTTTDATGHFQFSTVPPGTYYLATAKESSGRIGQAKVTVAAGATVVKPLALLLGPSP